MNVPDVAVVVVVVVVVVVLLQSSLAMAIDVLLLVSPDSITRVRSAFRPRDSSEQLKERNGDECSLTQYIDDHPGTTLGS